jgi:hypothetical protein
VRRYNDSGFSNANGVIRAHTAVLLPPASYCTGKVNSQGCQGAVASTGTPSTSSGAPFHVTASQVVNNKSGLLFYGLDARATPVSYGTLCLTAAKIKRTPVQTSGGNPPPADCSGTFDFEFNTLIQSGRDPALVAYQTLYAQYWYRDPASTAGSATTNALRFTITP